MTKGRFNGLEVDEGQQSLENVDIYKLLGGRIKSDAEVAEEFGEDDRGYHSKGKVWASGTDRFGSFISFDVTSAGFACISPDLSLHLELKKYPHSGEMRPREVDQPEVQEFLLASDGLHTWGTITASEQFFTLSKAHDHRPPSIIQEGHDAVSYWDIAYCEPFKPNEPTEVVMVRSRYEYVKTNPKVDQAEVEARLGPVCIQGNAVGDCPGTNGYYSYPCDTRHYVPYVPKDR